MFKVFRYIFNAIFQPRSIFSKGVGVKFHRPYMITNPELIDIGDYSIIQRNSKINCIVRYKCQKFDPSIKIGSRCYIGLYSQIYVMGHLIIGDDCVISDYIYINDALHPVEPFDLNILDYNIYSKGDIFIGDNCFIGYDVAILSGVNLGHHCVVASKSLVNKSFPPYSMVAGNPAKVIKIYNPLKKSWVKVKDV